jgi:hypothetical protein
MIRPAIFPMRADAPSFAPSEDQPPANTLVLWRSGFVELTCAGGCLTDAALLAAGVG